MKLKQLALSTEPVWFDGPQPFHGLRLQIRRETPAYRAAVMDMVVQRHGSMAGRKERDAEEIAKDDLFTRECVAEHLLRDWQGVETDDGTILPYSVGVGKDLAADDEFDWLFDFVIRKATTSTAYTSEALEAAAGNSESV